METKHDARSERQSNTKKAQENNESDQCIQVLDRLDIRSDEPKNKQQSNLQNLNTEKPGESVGARCDEDAESGHLVKSSPNEKKKIASEICKEKKLICKKVKIQDQNGSDTETKKMNLAAARVSKKNQIKSN